MHYISTAWNEMRPEIFVNCFRRAHIGTGGEEVQNLQEDEDDDFAGFGDFFTVDDDLITSELRSIEQLVDDRTQAEDPDADTDDDDEAPPKPAPTAAVALDSLGNVRSYFSSMPNSVDMLNLVGALENCILRDAGKKKKQSRIESFLK